MLFDDVISKKTPAKRAPKKRKLVFDDEIEIPSKLLTKQLKDTSDLLRDEVYVPSSKMMRLLIEKQGLGYSYYMNRCSDRVPLQARFLHNYTQKDNMIQKAIDITIMHEKGVCFWW